MKLLTLTAIFFSCLFTQPSPACLVPATASTLPAPHRLGPVLTGQAVDVVLSAQAALVWDLTTGKILYERNATQDRPIASLNKLLAVLMIRQHLQLSDVVVIPPEVQAAQRSGANIRLPIGEHATVSDLLAAGLIPSANDAMVTLAVATSSSEAAFVEEVNRYATQEGYRQTKLANATGLSGGEQHSTAQEVKRMFTAVLADPNLRPLLGQKHGVLTTQEGTRRAYLSTNKLLDTYLPIVAAKTGYTVEAGENLVIVTPDKNGHEIGAVILGSTDRFQDMKILVEWIWRNYSWS